MSKRTEDILASLLLAKKEWPRIHDNHCRIGYGSWGGCYCGSRWDMTIIRMEYDLTTMIIDCLYKEPDNNKLFSLYDAYNDNIYVKNTAGISKVEWDDIIRLHEAGKFHTIYKRDDILLVRDDSDECYKYLGSDKIYEGPFYNMVQFPKSQPRHERYPQWLEFKKKMAEDKSKRDKEWRKWREECINWFLSCFGLLKNDASNYKKVI